MYLTIMTLKMRYYTKIFNSITKNYIRHYSNNSPNITEKLTQRSLLRLTGKDSATLLQGLVTNDVNNLSSNVGCLYAMFLNTKGRVLYDSIIYKTPEADCYFIEVDKTVANTVQKHVNMYRLRRDVKVENMDGKYEVWVHFNPNVIPMDPKEMVDITSETLAPCIAPKGADTVVVKEINGGNILEFCDPRISILGSRIIIPVGCENAVYESYSKETEKKYKWFRYRLGIGEGVDDLPPGNCFPLEANCDYLHGVSFHKGCYLGQELTARSYHTGVIRKRYMPLFFDSVIETPFGKDEIVKAGDKNVGKLRGYEQNLGLALLRIANVIDSKRLVIKNCNAFTVKPLWWPSDKQKEDSSAVRV